jgi:hypothetical protein
MTKKQKEKEKAEAREYLLTLLKPGDTILTNLRRVSASGMSRLIQCLVIVDGEPRDISYHVAKLSYSYDSKTGYVRAGGAGMDMGFSVVYNLSSALFPNGFDCIGENCPSNDHRNVQPYPKGGKCPHCLCQINRSYWYKHQDSCNKHHSSGGYALKQRWI